MSTVPPSLVLLHGGAAHAAEAASTSDWPYALASVVLVGGVGGALYWYYSRQVEAS